MVAATPIPAYAYCSSAIASAASRVFIFINPKLWYYTGITGAVSANLILLVFFSNFPVILSNVVHLEPNSEHKLPHTTLTNVANLVTV